MELVAKPIIENKLSDYEIERGKYAYPKEKNFEKQTRHAPFT